MKQLILLLGLLLSSAASADMWKWVDANGNSHYVDSNRPIYTWIDNSGGVHYGDTPAHEDAVLVQLVRMSSGPASSSGGEAVSAYSASASGAHASRDDLVAQNCTRANEILASYLNSSQLSRTNDSGEQEVLTAAERQAAIVEAQEKTAYLCGQ